MFDVIILGGGPAGLTAALYARRYGLTTLLLEELYLGGQIVNAHLIENYPGFAEPVSGGDLIDSLEKELSVYQPEIAYDSVKEVRLDQAIKAVRSASRSYEGKTLIVATGSNPRPLGLAREDDLRGKGVSYCATCDGNFFKGKHVAVVGGGDTAVSDALYLSRICEKVSIIHRKENFRASKAEVDKLAATNNVEYHMSSRVTELLGGDNLNALRLTDKVSSDRTIPVNAVFVAIGATPNTSLFAKQLRLDEQGYIITDDSMYAGLPGVFAAGDVRSKALRQIVTAASDGATAAHGAMLTLQR